jgi:hypothetical protein
MPKSPLRKWIVVFAAPRVAAIACPLVCVGMAMGEVTFGFGVPLVVKWYQTEFSNVANSAVETPRLY